MNDYKKWGKKASTLFWWFVACIPLIYILVLSIGSIVSSNQTGTFDLSVFSTIFDRISEDFNSYVFTDLNNGISDFLSNLGIGASTSNSLATILTWFAQTWLIHIAIDVILIIPKICSRLLEKVCD